MQSHDSLQNRQPLNALSPPSVLNCRSNKLMSFASPKQLGAAPADVKGAVVLVVDDEPAWRTILETDLRMLGYSPVLAADAIEALNQSYEHDPDVAIVDLMLPGSDGWHLLSEIRARGTLIPIIFFSAYPMARAENTHPDVVACDFAASASLGQGRAGGAGATG